MPPKAASKKRAAPATESKAKRTKTAEAPAVPKSKRWAAVSGSRNADASFKEAVKDASRANGYICICRPYFVGKSGDDDSEDEYDSEDEEAESDPAGDGEKPKCDGGKTCPCQKPASENPDHRFILTYGGFCKFVAQRDMASVRCPDNFSMYTFNDHEAYGVLEVLQNLLLDWAEAKTWQDQWIVCEGLVLFLLDEGSMFLTIDDGEQADLFAKLIGRLFLTMLARLEAQKLLSETSDVKNLGLIMALFIKVASNMRSGSLLEDDDEETNARPSRFTWSPAKFDDYINAYAAKFGITLHGPDDMDGLTAELDTDVSLPAAEESWGWAQAFKSYQKNHGGSPPIGRSKSGIGGDALDITTWTSAERKKYNFDKKDPIKAAELKALKEGAVMCLA